MDGIKVTCQVPNKDKPAKVDLRVHNQWDVKDYVELEINGERYTFNGYELMAAITNCMNNCKSTFI